MPIGNLSAHFVDVFSWRLCRRIAAAVCALAIGAFSVNAQDSELEPSVYEHAYKGEYGHFSHWSGAFRRNEKVITIEYALCNLHEKPLRYKWIGPNITVGEGGHLSSGKCHIVSRDNNTITHDLNTSILFTQAGRAYTASAHIPKSRIAIPIEALPSALRNTARTFFGPPMTTPSLADLVYTQSRGDGELHHEVAWHPPSVKVAISTSAFSGVRFSEVADTISNAGFRAELVRLRELLAEEDQSGIPSYQLSSQVIGIERDAGSPVALNFSLKGFGKIVSDARIMMIHPETNRLITAFDVSVFAAE